MIPIHTENENKLTLQPIVDVFSGHCKIMKDKIHVWKIS